MAKYHGDIIYQVGAMYQRADDRNYPVAIALLLLFGFTGAHRFFLDDHTIGWIYLIGLASTLVIGVITLNLTLPILYFCLASVALVCEFLYFIYAWSHR